MAVETTTKEYEESNGIQSQPRLLFVSGGSVTLALQRSDGVWIDEGTYSTGVYEIMTDRAPIRVTPGAGASYEVV